MDINELPALDWNLSMKCVQAMLGCTSGELECIGEKALDGYVKDVQRVAAVLADRERQAGEAVAWFRVENGIRVYYETKAWDDLTPLFASTPAPQVVQAEPDMEKIRRDAVSNAMMTCMKGVTDAYRYFPAQGKDVEDFDRCAAEAMTKAVEFAVQLTAREVRDPVWPYAAAPSPDGKAEQAEAPSDADPLTPEQEEWVMDLAEKHNLGRRVPQIGAMRGVAPDVFYTDASYRTHELFCFAAALLSTKELT